MAPKTIREALRVVAIVLAMGVLIAGTDATALQGKEPRVDRFGDPLPEGALTRLGTMRLRHGNGFGVVFAPDGKSLLTSGGDRTIRTWDLASGHLLREQRLPAGFSSPLAVLSPDTRLMVFEETFSGLSLWDVRRNKRRHKLALDSQWPRVVFSPDSQMLAIAEDNGTLRIWDANTGKDRVLSRHKQRISSLSFAADGTLMSMRQDRIVHFWDLTANRERSRITLAEPVPGGVISPNGRIVATMSHGIVDPDKSLKFWDAATGKPLKDWICPNLKEVRSVRFSPDGKTVLIGTKEAGILWDPLAGKRVLTLAGQSGFDFTFSPDGRSVASLGGSTWANVYMESMVRVWDLTTGAPHAANKPQNGHCGQVDGIAFAPDGRTVASSSNYDKTVRLWEAATGRLLRTLPVKEGICFHALTFTPDGKDLLLGVGSAIIRWQVATGREVLRYFLAENGKLPRHLMKLHLCADARTLLGVIIQESKDNDGEYALLAWDAATGKHLRSVPLRVDNEWIAYSQFSPDGRLLVIPDGSIRDVATGKERARLRVDGKSLGTPIAFSPDGALIAMGVVGEVKRGEIEAREVVAVQVWETATLSPVAQLATSEVAHIAFTPDNRRLVAAGPDALKLWDVASGHMVARRPAPGRYRGSYGPSFASSFTLAANGHTVATGNADTTILLWDLTPSAPARSAAPLTLVEREACWTDLAGAEGGRAFVAIGRLIDAPSQAVEMLRGRLHPAKAPSAEELRGSIVDLDDPRFERREAAAKRLAALSEQANAALRAALRGKPSLEVRRRIEGLLAESQFVRIPEARRHLRAVRVLEQIGTREARDVLEGLAKGAPDARLTRAAKAALSRRTQGGLSSPARQVTK